MPFCAVVERAVIPIVILLEGRKRMAERRTMVGWTTDGRTTAASVTVVVGPVVAVVGGGEGCRGAGWQSSCDGGRGAGGSVAVAPASSRFVSKVSFEKNNI